MYQALYRKYRPLNFNDVVGQEHIVNTLKNAISYNYISHAYLFSGPRGTGKTTIAKIFARAVNCLEPVDGLACGKCKNCIYSFSKECMDIIEIDAASNNGVDEIRELRSNVNILPSELKYKVYIIDEVHMLSIGAFNALLKTIEGPPSHVIFILATTDPQKVPSTIISRCQCYNFKKIDNSNIVKRLKLIVDDENIAIDEKVLEKIAESSDGGLRDAIGLLDKIRAYCVDEIKVEDFYRINGQIDDEELEMFENLIFAAKSKEVLMKLEQYYQDGKNLVQIIKQLMLKIKDDLFDYYINNKKLAVAEYDMVNFLNTLNDNMVNLKKSDDIRLSLEIMLLHYMDVNNKNKRNLNTSYNEETKKETKEFRKKEINLGNYDKETDEDKNSLIIKNKTKIANFYEIMNIRSKNTMLEASKSELTKELENFKKINDFVFDQTTGYLACELLDGQVRASSSQTLIISYEYEGMIDKIIDHFDELINFYNNKFDTSKNIAIITNQKWNDLKNEYIKLKKNGNSFTYEEEPKPILNVLEKNVKIENENSTNSFIDEAVNLFGNIVEIR